MTPLENVSQQEFDLDKYNLELLVVDTQASHQLNDGQYAQRRATCEEAAKILGVANLRVTADGISKADDQFQALKETLDALPDETMKKRVRHVVTEIERVRSFVRAFAQGDIKAAGRLFNASHDSLAADYEVTVPELDIAVDVARKNGAYGARMTGGGFGAPSSRWWTRVVLRKSLRRSPTNSKSKASTHRARLPRTRRNPLHARHDNKSQC